MILKDLTKIIHDDNSFKKFSEIFMQYVNALSILKNLIINVND